jgi:hypothetical protein
MTLAALAVILRLVMDLATPLLPGAFVLDADAFVDAHTARASSAVPAVDRHAAPGKEVPRAAVTTALVKRVSVVREGPPWRDHMSHPLRQPDVGAPASSDIPPDR